MIYDKVWKTIHVEDVQVGPAGLRTKDEQIAWLLGKLNAAGRRVVSLQRKTNRLEARTVKPYRVAPFVDGV